MTLTDRIPGKILMTTDTIGGVWTCSIELARALEEFGIEVALATMGAPLHESQRREIRSLPNIQLFESTFKLEWMDDPWPDVERAARWLLDIESAFAPDIVHLNSFSFGACPFRAPKIVVGHSCILSWWRAVFGVDAPARFDQYRENVMAGLFGADLIAAPSAAMLEALNTHYGPLPTGRVIYNGRSLQTRSRAKHDFILATGSIQDKAKNIPMLTSIAARVPWPVYIAGPRQIPGTQAADCDVPEENVHHLGSLSERELLPYYERASIYVLPARYEPFGWSALEAGLAGCALVLGDIPVLHEIWGDAAFYVSPEDPQALERLLRDLIGSPAEIARMAGKARRVAGQYSAERFAAEYLAACSVLGDVRPFSESKPIAQKNSGFPLTIPLTAGH